MSVPFEKQFTELQIASRRAYLKKLRIDNPPEVMLDREPISFLQQESVTLREMYEFFLYVGLKHQEGLWDNPRNPQLIEFLKIGALTAASAIMLQHRMLDSFIAGATINTADLEQAFGGSN